MDDLSSSGQKIDLFANSDADFDELIAEHLIADGGMDIYSEMVESGELEDLKGEWLESGKKFNLIELLGTIKRDNKDFAGYKENPELFDKLGAKGVKFRESPDWLTDGRPFALGNTVFVPPEAISSIQEDSFSAARYIIKHGADPEEVAKNPYTFLAKEEIPHVAQYRDKGLLGFFASYIGSLFKNKFDQRKIYDDEGSLEGFHMHDYEEKEALQRSILDG